MPSLADSYNLLPSFLIAVSWATVLKGVIINKLSIKKMAEILFFIL
jgi:hypothetical protein